MESEGRHKLYDRIPACAEASAGRYPAKGWKLRREFLNIHKLAPITDPLKKGFFITLTGKEFPLFLIIRLVPSPL